MADAITTAAAVQSIVDLTPLAKGLAFGLSAGCACLGIGMVFSSAIQGIARQPEQAGVLRGLAFLGFAFIEALALIGFVMNWLIK